MPTNKHPYGGLGTAALMVAVMMCAAAPSARRRATADEPGQSLHARFGVAARQACDDRSHVGVCDVTAMTRTQLSEEIAHYRILLQVGSGPFDVIAIHRLVRERQPGVPFQTHGSFFHLHGSSGHFSLSLVHDPNLLTYLARADVDVWGVDLRWVQVPRSQTDFGFMKEWTFGTQVGDIMLATRFARHVRRLTGQGFARLNLAGASLGASLVFAVANAEATLPDDERDVAGLIPNDTIYSLPPGPGATRTLFCRTEASYRAALASGGYTLNSLGSIDAGIRAMTDPDAVSPSPPLTNREVVLNAGAAFTFPPALQYHIYAVVRDSAGRPVDGRFTPPERMFETFANFAPWRARATMADYFGVACGKTELAYDDHLAEITVPILYVGFAGGMGREGMHVLQLVGSQDVTTTYVQLLPDDQASDDFGHLDWQAAGIAPMLVWEPIRSWLAIH